MSEKSSAAPLQPDDEAHTIDLTDTTGKIMVCVEYTKEEVEQMDEQPHPLDKKAWVMGYPEKVRR